MNKYVLPLIFEQERRRKKIKSSVPNNQIEEIRA